VTDDFLLQEIACRVRASSQYFVKLTVNSGKEARLSI